MRIDNKTPFVLTWLVALDKHAAEHLVVVLKATYAIGADGALSLADPQEPLKPADEFYGEPGKSSIRREAELTPAKPATDVVLIGSAIAPKGRARQMEVSLRVGPLVKRVRVFGERRWVGLLGMKTSPAPFERIPLIYENAYGGSDASPEDEKRHAHEPRNPVGRGFRAKRTRMKVRGDLLPHIEDVRTPLKRPGHAVAPQGFGFIGRNWQPRLSYAGTYDEKWMEARMPLLPLDFDERYHNGAHPDLVAKGHLVGDELVDVVGCTTGGRLQFKLPGVKPQASVRISGHKSPVALNIDTVAIDSDAMRLVLLWKGDVHVHRKLPQVEVVAAELEGGAA